MTWLTQTTRFLRLETPLGEDVLIPTYFSGEETLSKPFQYKLRMISDNTQIKPTHLLGKAVTLTLNSGANYPPRYFNGYVYQFQAGAITEGVRHYQAILHPWLSFLNYSSDCQIFQQKNVVAIVEAIFSAFHFTHFDTTHLSQSYPTRDYCVQYRETALQFISRLLQEEGIYYFFQQEEHKHTLILADSFTAIKPILNAEVQYTAGSHKNECITRLTRYYRFYSGKISHADYNYQTPDTRLLTTQQSTTPLKATQNYEQFDYPGAYADNHHGQSLAQHRLQAHETQYDSLRGSSNYQSFSSGSKFSLNNAPDADDNGDYTLTRVIHHAVDDSYLHGNNGNQAYHNKFDCIPANIPFKPARLTKPTITGAQTAVVVGGADEDLATNHYGQVKIQFHWDRYGKKNECSSCWVRVAQLWAGNNWGAVFMPRIGQEVLVHFLEGDPDRPIIMGTVYNGNNTPPYALPGQQTRSGLRTASTKSANADDYNELYFEDQTGEEEIFIQAQRNFNKLVKNNLNITVKNDHSQQTLHDSVLNVGHDHCHNTTNDYTITIGHDHLHTTANNSATIVNNNYTQSTGNNVINTVGNDFNHEVTNNATQVVGHDSFQVIGNDLNQDISQNLNLTVGKSALVQAAQTITLKVGANYLLINSEGVVINGAMVKINS